MEDYLDLFDPAFPQNDFSWSDILSQFGFYPPALVSVAAAIANPTYQNIRNVETSYRQGGYQPPAPLMSFLWNKYYEHTGYQLPGNIYSFGSDYWPLILLGVGAFILLRK